MQPGRTGRGKATRADRFAVPGGASTPTQSRERGCKAPI